MISPPAAHPFHRALTAGQQALDSKWAGRAQKGRPKIRGIEEPHVQEDGTVVFERADGVTMFVLLDNIGRSPGELRIIGLQFTLKNGTTFRASMPTAWFVQFHLELQLALETAARRMEIAGSERRH